MTADVQRRSSKTTKKGRAISLDSILRGTIILLAMLTIIVFAPALFNEVAEHTAPKPHFNFAMMYSSSATNRPAPVKAVLCSEMSSTMKGIPSKDKNSEQYFNIIPSPHSGLLSSPLCGAIRRSTKYSPECGAVASNVYPVLITGYGTSGIGYTVALLQELGVEIAGDSHPLRLPGADGAGSWLFAFADDEDQYPSWSTRLMGGRFKRVFVQLRHPLKSIGAQLNNDHLFHPFIDRHTTIHQVMGASAAIYPALTRAMQHWITWHEFLEQVSDWTYRVEDVMLGELYARAGYSERHHLQKWDIAAAAEGARKRCPMETPTVPITWDMLENADAASARKVKEMAIAMGYQIQR